MEQPPSEAVLDIKPEMDDDDLIDEETPPESANHGRQRGPSGRPTAPLYRPSHGGGGRLASGGRSSDETSVHHSGRLGRLSDEGTAHHGSGRLASGRSSDEGTAHQGGGGGGSGRQQHGDSHRHHHHHQDSRSGRSTRTASSRPGRYETSREESLQVGGR